MITTDREEKIYKYWYLHDGAWYQETARRYGFDVANEMNKAALRQMAKRTMQTYVREHKLIPSKLGLDEQIHHFMEGAKEMWPEHWVDLECVRLSDNEFEVITRSNFSIDMLRRAGTLDRYECPGLVLREGWFEGLGIQHYVQEERECMVRGDAVCRYYARIGTGA